MSRQTIRADLVARLRAATTVTAIVPSTRIYDSKVSPIPTSGLPAIVVCTPSTRRAAYGKHEPTFKATHEIAIDCLVTGADADDVAAAADTLGEVVITALLTDPLWVASFEAIGDVDDEIILDAREVRQGVCRITLSVQISEEYVPTSTVITSFDGVDLQIDMIDPGGDDGEPDGTVDGAVTIDLEGA